MRYLALFTMLLAGCSSDSNPSSDMNVCVDCMDVGEDVTTDVPDASDVSYDASEMDTGQDVNPFEEFRGFVPHLRLNESQVVGRSSRDTSTNMGSTSGLLVVRGGPDTYIVERKLEYDPGLSPGENRSQVDVIPWQDGHFLVTYDFINIVVEYDENLEPVRELQIDDIVYGTYNYGNQAVVFGKDFITFVEASLFGLRVARKISREIADYEFINGLPYRDQVIIDDVLYHVAYTQSSQTAVAAWDLTAEDPQSALLGISEEADTSNLNVSASIENARAFVSDNGQKSIAVFSLTNPTSLVTSLDIEPFMRSPNADVYHTTSGDWLVVTIRVAGNSDEGMFVFDTSSDDFNCLGQLANGEFNQNGAVDVRLIGIGDEVFVREINRNPIVDRVQLRSMSRDDFVLSPCP